MAYKTIFRINKNKNYTTISNLVLLDKRLSLKARGLLALVLTLPDDWNFSKNGLLSLCGENEGKRSIESAMKELIKYGYLVVTKLPPQKENNVYTYVYKWCEEPQNVDLQNEDIQNVGVQNVDLQNVSLYTNTNIPSTNIQNTNILNTNNIYMAKSKKSKFVPPTFEEVEAYIKEKGLKVNAKKFYKYYEDSNWHKGNGQPVRYWKQCVSTWANNDYDNNEIDTRYKEARIKEIEKKTKSIDEKFDKAVSSIFDKFSTKKLT